MSENQNFWSKNAETLLKELKTGPDGLTGAEAKGRLQQYGENTIKTKKKTGVFQLLLTQFKSPIIIILLFATALSVFIGNTSDAVIIFAIVLISGMLGFFQEYSAGKAVSLLLDLVSIKAAVLRDQKEVEISVESIVPGDIVILNAGDVVPGDCLICESVSLFADESALTGETYPIEKQAGIVPENTELHDRTNCLWMGTHVISGTAKAVIVKTGRETEFGAISEHLKLRPPETEFERGIRKFGYMLLVITLILIFAIFAINIITKKALLDSFMFSLALAVGLTPQLLPVIISINLARGTKAMAKVKVIVKRLSAIENLGSMNVLCSDKTGTLTDGVVKLKETWNIAGEHSDKVLLYTYLNAFYESGFINPIDAAIRSAEAPDIAAFSKLGEQPYDFIRKRLSILVSEGEKQKDPRNIIITKGAFDKVLEVCGKAEMADGSIVDLETIKDQIYAKYRGCSGEGYRVLGLAYKDNGTEKTFTRASETEMVFLGFVVLFDPLKPGAAEAIKNLEKLQVSLKVITGDNRYIAANVIREIGVADAHIMTGTELSDMNDTALALKVNSIDVFAEVEPNQKERIIVALKKAGNVVGYIGDGINDVSAMHDADVSISVDDAVDVAKEAADIVLLEKDLAVLHDGIISGRTTFANTLKYIFMATSANFGNMFSMAGVSIFLPFLPLLPKQVLLTNLMTDFPELTIATDNVDYESIEKPRRWDIKFIRKFMLTFGFVSSAFDYMTFGALLLLSNITQIQFRTGWFTESVISAALIVLVIRSRRPLHKSRPGKQLVTVTLLVVAAVLILPYLPIAGILGLAPLPASVLGMIGGIIAIYILTAEVVKMIFYKYVD